jgi:hypothetical protein
MGRLSIISSLLKNNGVTSALIEEAFAVSALNKLLKKALPASIAEHITLSAIKDQTAHLQSDSAAWAAQLRYITPELMRSLSKLKEFETVTNIRVKVRPESLPVERRREKLKLSRSASDTISRYASSLTDAKTRDAFKRIAKHVK